MAAKKKCARTDTVFLPISEVSDGTVSLELFGSKNGTGSLLPGTVAFETKYY